MNQNCYQFSNFFMRTLYESTYIFLLLLLLNNMQVQNDKRPGFKIFKISSNTRQFVSAPTGAQTLVLAHQWLHCRIDIYVQFLMPFESVFKIYNYSVNMELYTVRHGKLCLLCESLWIFYNYFTTQSFQISVTYKYKRF